MDKTTKLATQKTLIRFKLETMMNYKSNSKQSQNQDKKKILMMTWHQE